MPPGTYGREPQGWGRGTNSDNNPAFQRLLLVWSTILTLDTGKFFQKPQTSKRKVVKCNILF